MRMKLFWGSLVLAMAATSGQAQFIGNGLSQSRATQSTPVEYIFPAPMTVPAGKPAKITLHFRIAEGLHINSHTPHDEFLIPTVFSLPSDRGVRLLRVDYPAGVDRLLPANPKEKLNVYTDQFFLEALIVAEPGEHPVAGKLRYQACDQHECMPPRTIPISLDILGK